MQVVLAIGAKLARVEYQIGERFGVRPGLRARGLVHQRVGADCLDEPDEEAPLDSETHGDKQGWPEHARVERRGEGGLIEAVQAQVGALQ